MNKLIKTCSKSSQQIQVFTNQVQIALATVFLRLGQELTPHEIEIFLRDVVDSYSNIPVEHIINALKNGAKGLYGRTFKLNTQEMNIWIQKYLENNPLEVNDIDHPTKFRVEHFGDIWELKNGVYYRNGKFFDNEAMFRYVYDMAKNKYEEKQ